MIPFIETHTGGRWWPAHSEHPFLIEDIAHALSNICRFGGHCREFYSVAQHSCLVHDWIAEHFPDFPNLLLPGLMHDAAEAYLGDHAGPFKAILPHYSMVNQLEDDVQRGIEREFSFQSEPIVKRADNAVLAAEARDLMYSRGKSWGDWIREEPWPVQIIPWTPKLAKQKFLDRFRALEETR